MKKIKGILKVIIVNFIIFFSLLLLVDPFIKSDFAYVPETNRSISLREIAPNLNITFKNRQQVQINPRAELKDIEINTDKDGFLRNQLNFEDYDYADVVFLGGSTTLSLYVDQNLRWTRLVENRVSETLNEKIKILNSSNGGNHSMHSNLKLIAKVIEKKPQVVVLMNVINDMSLLSKTGSYFFTPPSRSLINNKFSENNEQSNYSSLSYNLRKIIFTLYPNLYGLIRDRVLGYGSVNLRNDEYKDFRSTLIEEQIALKEYKKSLELFISICRIYDIKPVLMTQFNSFSELNMDYVIDSYLKDFNSKEDILYFLNLYSKANQLVRDIAKKNNVNLIDLDLEIPKNLDNFVDVIHLSNKGSIAVSEVVAEHISKLLK